MRDWTSAAGHRPLDYDEIDRHMRRARVLRSQAMAAYAAAALRGLGALWRGSLAAAAAIPHSRLWRAPGTGNCLNC